MGGRHGVMSPICVVATLLGATLVLAFLTLCVLGSFGRGSLSQSAIPSVVTSMEWAYRLLHWGLLLSLLIALLAVRRPFGQGVRPSFDLKVFVALEVAMFLTGLILTGALKNKAVIPICAVYVALSAGALAAWTIGRRKKARDFPRPTPVDGFLAIACGFYAADTTFGMAISWSPKYAEVQLVTGAMEAFLWLYLTAYGLRLVTLGNAELEKRQICGAATGISAGGTKQELAGLLVLVFGIIAVLALVVIRLALASIQASSSNVV
jgi:hypothetical protein